jgi:hypothetical protein
VAEVHLGVGGALEGMLVGWWCIVKEALGLVNHSHPQRLGLTVWKQKRVKESSLDKYSASADKWVRSHVP